MYIEQAMVHWANDACEGKAVTGVPFLSSVMSGELFSWGWSLQCFLGYSFTSPKHTGVLTLLQGFSNSVRILGCSLDLDFLKIVLQ